MVHSGLYVPNNLVIQLFLNNQLSSNLEQQKINIYQTEATVAGIKNQYHLCTLNHLFFYF